MNLFRCLRPLRDFVCSRRATSVFKGALAYWLAVLVPFIHSVNKLVKYPVVYPSIVLISIAAFPGRSTGACVEQVVLCVLGVCIGCANFAIMAALRGSLIAQAIVFGLMIYFIGLVKASGPKFFSGAVLAILVTFDGVYTSILVGKLDLQYLRSYLIVYLIGGGIGLTVNLMVRPITAERKLRGTLVLSLEHISTFFHLLTKVYTLTATEDEKIQCDILNQEIRGDFGLLNQTIGAATMEANWSRWSIEDYRELITHTRALQVSLITLYGSLHGYKLHSIGVFATHFLPITFRKLELIKLDIDQILRSVEEHLVLPHFQAPAYRLDLGSTGYEPYFDLERQKGAAPRLRGADIFVEPEVAEILRHVGMDAEPALQLEIPTNAKALNDFLRSGIWNEQLTMLNSVGQDSPSQAATVIAEKDGSNSPMESLKSNFEEFRHAQRNVSIRVLASGNLHGQKNNFRIKTPRPSVWNEHQGTSNDAWRRRKSAQDQNIDVDSGGVDFSNHSLMRVSSMLFAIDQIITTLEPLHKLSSQPRSNRFRFHFFEPLSHVRRIVSARSGTSQEPVSMSELDHPMSTEEALSILERKPYSPPPKPTIWMRLSDLENYLRTPQSIYAGKLAAAAMIFGALIWGERSRAFFLSYGMSSSLLTVVVALSPTLGQSMRSWVLQVSGSSLGYVIGMVFLEIFKGVGGNHFNSYGVLGLLAPYSLLLAFILYERPKLFTGALLSMNATGVIILREYEYIVWMKSQVYGEPPIRVAKSLAGLAIALAIVITFQLFVLRNPARHVLRKKLAKLVADNSRYNTILQALIHHTLPQCPSDHTSQAAIDQVLKELKDREIEIQGDILATFPLVGFARDEPQFPRPFQVTTVLKIIRANQIILDRLRASRFSVSKTFSPELIEAVNPLLPYRRQLTDITYSRFMLTEASLSLKTPLPRSSTSERWLADLIHDALVASHLFAQMPEGKACIQAGELARYWFHLLSITTIIHQLEVMEAACETMFGNADNNWRRR